MAAWLGVPRPHAKVEKISRREGWEKVKQLSVSISPDGRSLAGASFAPVLALVGGWKAVAG